MNLKSYLIALSVALVLVAWMLSGRLDSDDARPGEDQSPAQPVVMDVEVTTLEAESVERFLESQGETEAERDIELRAETSGQVVAVQAAEGDAVAAGDPILRIAMGDREARRAEARARVSQREADFSAARRLSGDGFQSEIALREARAALEAARAQLATIEEEIANTTITAPIAGRVETLSVDKGDYLAAGERVARILDIDPLIATAHVAQQEIRRIETGREARVSLATGDTLTGTVRNIGGAAEPGSRTFRVEVAAANPDALPVGVSATIRIPLDPARAHFLSPAWLALAESGEVGVKTVDADNRVVFEPVDIVRTQRDGVWVTGLADPVRLITVGQGFVRAGDTVNPVPVDASVSDG
ncbi:efflux RND transporter periplasmic adaptor subunit [Spiribacter vilamensis]|uniref:Multidrug efflux system membrane fusion protein n=1 Tax=Spiribacter vilamensis TaxID=531306 RepID=A0A4Q8D2R4_9GAMM|nr:efflux RND transporter periplasmic adaptor subunit [Spiribacter vilamensis]RZU99653.1 multidrug efflux system membrane fusion protein [Spiribacter vilamensis]TVO61391.1 efflux RND transporter periplasmic adaptor subunit [Spiribacter vilamensis]